jgi:hypothetical protein
MRKVTARLPYSFIEKFGPLTWPEIDFGFTRELISADVVIEFARACVAKSEEANPLEVKIAESSVNDAISGDLRKLSHIDVDRAQIKKKWVLLLLTWMYQHRSMISDPLTLIEDIYTEFDYPEEIAPLIRYMPSVDPDLGSKELNEARLIKKWGEFVEKNSPP